MLEKGDGTSSALQAHGYDVVRSLDCSQSLTPTASYFLELGCGMIWITLDSGKDQTCSVLRTLTTWVPEVKAAGIKVVLLRWLGPIGVKNQQ